MERMEAWNGERCLNDLTPTCEVLCPGHNLHFTITLVEGKVMQNLGIFYLCMWFFSTFGELQGVSKMYGDGRLATTGLQVDPG